MHSNLSGPTKAVCYREVFTIRRVCYERFHCNYVKYISARNVLQIPSCFDQV